MNNHRQHRVATSDPADRSPETPQGRGSALSRRRFLQLGMMVAAAGPIMTAKPVESTLHAGNAIEEHTLSFGRTLHLVHLSDIHIGPAMSRIRLRGYMEQVGAMQPDLLVLTGDLLNRSMDGLEDGVAELARIQPPYGTFVSLGNHEHWFGQPEMVTRAFERQGLRVLTNQREVVATREGPIVMAGIDDLGSGRADLAAAVQDRPEACPTILLSHHPEIFPLAARADVELTLAGHWHGGQIRIPIPGGYLSIAHLNTPYPEGLYRRGNSLLYVSRGLGTSLLPIRINTPPEISVLHLF